ncbi:MAG: M48 family metallopeptidase, partial [Elusimicrobiota bacterium]|nr:M48 family metallopeptidase [Elusimicrobiota bacterium]
AAAPAPGTRAAALAARWREFGADAASSPLVTRQRGRYEFGVSAGAGVNAFAMPGGFVFATRGLLERLERDEDALLFVLGHEIGHVELGHCADGWRLREGRGPGGAVAGAVLSVGRLLAELHFSEVQELEADAFGARLVASRGRDPAGGLRALGALGLTGDTATKRDPGAVAVETLADYFRTHPGSWERRAALERAIAGLRRTP